MGYLEWEMLPEDPHSRAAALLQVIAQELGPRSSWQQVGPPAEGEAAATAAANLLLQNRSPAHSHQSSAAGLGDWRNNSCVDGGVAAAAAAAAVAAVAGGEACNGIVSNRPAAMGSYGNVSSLYGAQPVFNTSLGPYSVLDGSSMYANISSMYGNNTMLGVPATPVGVSMNNFNSWQGVTGGIWGGSGLASYSSLWGMDAIGAAGMLQQQQALEAFLSAGLPGNQTIEPFAAPRQVIPEHLAVGGPTLTSSRNSSCGSQSAGSPGNKGDSPQNAVAGSLTASPEHSAAGSSGSSRRSSCGETVTAEEASNRMAPFLWGDGLGIWGSLATAGQQ